MKSIHWGLLALLVVAYLVGAKYPSPANMVLSKVGL